MIKRCVDVHLTPQELADELSEMQSHEQALFLNALALRPWWREQLVYVAKDARLTDKARALMRLLGEYSGWGKDEK